jgi:hypothetical protein
MLQLLVAQRLSIAFVDVSDLAVAQHSHGSSVGHLLVLAANEEQELLGCTQAPLAK